MKVTLEIELDIPDIEGYSEEERDQLLFDAYTHYVTLKHLQDALKWSGKVSDTYSTEAKIYDYHNTWADISASAKVVVK